MNSKMTKGINIHTETFFQPEFSNVETDEFLFSYRITISNNNDFPVQLIRRHWFIYESNGSLKEVEGEGVVGVQPLINPGESYQYISACKLNSEIGKMEGSYLMKDINNNKTFSVMIPEMLLQVPFKLN